MIIHADITGNEFVSATLGYNGNVSLRINNDNVYDTLFEKIFATSNVTYPFFINGQGGYYGVNTTFQDNTAVNTGRHLSVIIYPQTLVHK